MGVGRGVGMGVGRGVGRGGVGTASARAVGRVVSTEDESAIR